VHHQLKIKDHLNLKNRLKIPFSRLVNICSFGVEVGTLWV